MNTTTTATTGAEEEETDSAVPLSPLSLNSGDASPGLGGMGDGERCKGATMLEVSNGPTTVAMAVSRRKRHTGGPGRVRGLIGRSCGDEEPEVFSLDEQDDQFFDENAAVTTDVQIRHADGYSTDADGETDGNALFPRH